MMGIEVIDHKQDMNGVKRILKFSKGFGLKSLELSTMNVRGTKSPGGTYNPGQCQNPHPTIANAGGSEDAKEMVSKLCDWSFITPSGFRGCESSGVRYKR